MRPADATHPRPLGGDGRQRHRRALQPPRPPPARSRTLAPAPPHALQLTPSLAATSSQACLSQIPAIATESTSVSARLVYAGTEARPPGQLHQKLCVLASLREAWYPPTQRPS